MYDRANISIMFCCRSHYCYFDTLQHLLLPKRFISKRLCDRHDALLTQAFTEPPF